MGSTALPCTSLRTTIGMLVTGSIIKPRIFISSSIVVSCAAFYHCATKRTIQTFSVVLLTALCRGPRSPNELGVFGKNAIGCAACNPHRNILTEQVGAGGREVHYAVAGAVPVPLVFFLGFPVYVYFKNLPLHPAQRLKLN